MSSTAGVKPNRIGVFISVTKPMSKAMVVASVSETARPRAQIQAASVTISGSRPRPPTISAVQRVDGDAGGDAGEQRERHGHAVACGKRRDDGAEHQHRTRRDVDRRARRCRSSRRPRRWRARRSARPAREVRQSSAKRGLIDGEDDRKQQRGGSHRVAREHARRARDMLANSSRKASPSRERRRRCRAGAAARRPSRRAAAGR